MKNETQMNNQDLRKFGLVTGFIFAALFGLLFPWLFDHTIPYWPWILGSTLSFWAIVHPRSLNPVYTLWMKIGHVLGWINTRIILAIMFYLLFFPIAIIMKIFGKDPMYKKLDSELASYRKESIPQPKEHIEKPF